MPVLSEPELAVSLDLIRPGAPGTAGIGITTGDMTLPAFGFFTAGFSVWAARETCVVGDELSGRQPEPEDITEVGLDLIADSVLMINTAAGLAGTFGPCTPFHVGMLTSLIAQGGLVGWVHRLELSL